VRRRAEGDDGVIVTGAAVRRDGTVVVVVGALLAWPARRTVTAAGSKPSRPGREAVAVAAARAASSRRVEARGGRMVVRGARRGEGALAHAR